MASTVQKYNETSNRTQDQDWESGDSVEFGYDDSEVGWDGDGEESTPAMGASDLRTRINQLKNEAGDSATVRRELQALEGRVNFAMSLSPEQRAAKLAEAQETLCQIESGLCSTDGAGEGGDISEDDSAAGGLKQELQGLLERVNDDEKIGDSDRTELRTEIEKMIAKCDTNPSEVVVENMEEDFEELQGRVEELRSVSSSAKNLEGTFGSKTPEEIQKIAQDKGIDLDNLPKPPTQEVFEFLAENIPELKAAYQKAKDAVAAKKKMDTDNVASAQRKSASNLASTTDCDYDREGLQDFIYLMKAQSHQDQGSTDLAKAYSECTTQLASALKKLYPDVQINAVGTSFDDCDLINFDNQKIDVLSNSEGTFIASTSLTMDPEMPLPSLVTLEYDWEGDGDYEDGNHDNLNWLQGQGYPTHCYDA